MRIDLKKFFSREDVCQSFDYSFTMPPTEVDGCFPFVSPVSAKGELRSAVGEVELWADVSYDFSMPCNRCMEDHFTSLHYRVSHRLVRSLNEEDNDSFILVEGDELDLDDLLYSDLILNLPAKYICKEDCKGLCPVCGANLNLKSCDCSRGAKDSRFEILKTLIE